MATIMITIRVDPSEYDMIVDGLSHHRDTIVNELENPISLMNESESLREEAVRMKEKLDRLLGIIYGSEA